MHLSDAETESVLATLRAVPLFSGLPHELLTRLLGELEVLSAPAGQKVVAKGQAADAMYIVVSGTLEVRIEAEGCGKQLEVVGPGDWFGEMALLTDEPRSAAVVALSAGRLLRLDKERFLSLSVQHPAFLREITRVLCRRLARRSEEQLRSARLAAVGELAAGIAHETRNPLGAISHATETLQRSLRLQGEDAELLEIIRREAGRLNEIVSDFLVFGRPRPLVLQETDLAALIKDVLLALEQDERCHGGVRFEAVLDPALPRLALDPHQMSQVLWNLYLNAAQAMPGGGCLRTRAALQAGPDGQTWLSLEISDTGPGLPCEAQGRLFEPFFTTRPDGTGLGLPIARRIIEEHGGTLTLENGLTGGAAARILLPCREGPAGAPDPGRSRRVRDAA